MPWQGSSPTYGACPSKGLLPAYRRGFQDAIERFFWDCCIGTPEPLPLRPKKRIPPRRRPKEKARSPTMLHVSNGHNVPLSFGVGVVRELTCACAAKARCKRVEARSSQPEGAIRLALLFMDAAAIRLNCAQGRSSDTLTQKRSGPSRARRRCDRGNVKKPRDGRLARL